MQRQNASQNTSQTVSHSDALTKPVALRMFGLSEVQDRVFVSDLNGRIYRHYKGGEYLVFGEGIHTETEEDLVFYCSTKDWKLYARPRDMFFSDVELNGKIRKRFEPVD